MYQWTTKTIAETLDIECRGPADVIPERVVFDSREVMPGDLFVAIRGERVDGARFIGQAVQAGAVAVAAPAEAAVPEGTAHLVHSDGVGFIQGLGRAHRRLFQGPVIAITGSQGKTSTKDLLTHLMRADHEVVVTHENQNNELGLPLTMTRLEEGTEVLIVEMGMTGFGEIDFLAAMAEPTHAIITNIGEVHAEQLGDRAGIARAKTELMKYLPRNGTIAVREGDRSWLEPYLGECLATTFWTSTGTPSKWTPWACATGIVLGEDCLSFTYSDDKGRSFPLRLPYAGRHMVDNCLLAMAIATTLGVPSSTCIEALAKATPLSGHRMAKVEIAGRLFLDDSYNANPASMRATLAVLGAYRGRQRVACLGDMYELGIYEERGHRSVGQTAYEEDIDLLIVLGEKARLIGEAALEAGMAASQVHFVASTEEAAARLKEELEDGAVVLVKGSHSLRMAEIIEHLRQ